MKERPQILPVADNRGGKQRTIMLVEDSEIDRLTYKRYLNNRSEFEYSFIEAETGTEALELYESDRLDLILLDYLLPDFNGLEWLQQLQQQYSNLCPVIVLTGQGDESVAVQFIKLGATDYLVKDRITAEKLSLAVDKAIAFKQLQQDKDGLIAQLRTSNDKLRDSNEKYRQEIAKQKKLKQIIDNVPMVVYAKEVDPQTKQSGKLWLINPEFKRIFDTTEAEVIGKKDVELFPPEMAKVFAVNDLIVTESKQPLMAEESVYQVDGKLHTYRSLKFPLLDEKKQVTSIIGIATDITEEKQNKIKIKQSEARFRNTFEQAAVGIAHLAINGKWLRVNQKLCQIVGYTPQELLEKTFQEITYPADLDTDLDYIKRMLAGEIATCSLEKRYIHRSGLPVWINLTVSLVRKHDDEPDYFISVIEDISDRKALELSLQNSLTRLSNLHQIDRAILAIEKPQAIAKTVISHIQNFLACQRASVYTFDWQENTATILSCQGLGKQIIDDGFEITLDVWHDLIEQLQNQSRNQEQNYIVTCFNQIPSHLQVLKPLEIDKLDCSIIFPLKSQGNLLGILQLWVENPVEITTGEGVAMVGEISGQLAIALQQAYLYRQIQNYTLELEERVSQRTAQLEEINQELKAFSYTISHDLKAPLRAIQGFANALQEDYAENLDELGKEYAWRLTTSAQQMERLIQDLLAYSRLSRSQIQLQKVDSTQIVAKVLEQLEPELAKTQAQITVAKPLLNMIGNQTILFQVISNLLSNAIKFTDLDVVPQIHIWTEIRDKIDRNSKGDRVRMWIEDNGIGIEPQHQPRIFQVFERLHGSEAYSGTGIGLAIVKKGMERLGGTSGVESQPNRGSRFWIEGLRPS